MKTPAYEYQLALIGFLRARYQRDRAMQAHWSDRMEELDELLADHERAAMDEFAQELRQTYVDARGNLIGVPDEASVVGETYLIESAGALVAQARSSAAWKLVA